MAERALDGKTRLIETRVVFELKHVDAGNDLMVRLIETRVVFES